MIASDAGIAGQRGELLGRERDVELGVRRQKDNIRQNGHMSASERQGLISKVQQERNGRLCIVYVTSTRHGLDVPIGDDMVPLLYEHLRMNRELAAKGVDLFVHSNGGSGTTPWRLVNLIREYTKSFAVLVPHRAFSAATLVALGADEIVMHQMGNLGPIDPSVTNAFNPPNPVAPGQLAAISVEEVSAFFKLVKEEIGIRHEDELVVALNALTEKIHPLALGNVQRSHNQSRMLARKLLQTRTPKLPDHEISKLIDTLKSNLFYHGHPISRKEAKDDLNLNVVEPTSNLETLMWDLYSKYSETMKLAEPLQPLHEIEEANRGRPAPGALTTQDILTQMAGLAKVGLGLGAVPEAQLVNLAAAIAAQLKPGAELSKKAALTAIPGAYIETVGRTDVFKVDMNLSRATIPSPGGPQEVVKQEVVWQRWEKES